MVRGVSIGATMGAAPAAPKSQSSGFWSSIGLSRVAEGAASGRAGSAQQIPELRQDIDEAPIAQSNEDPGCVLRQPRVELEARALSPTFKLGDPIEIRITLHNRGSETLQVPSKLDVEAGTLWVMVNGSPLMKGKGKSDLSRLQSVAPGAWHTWTVRLDPAHFTAAGRYGLTLQIALKELSQSFMTCDVEVR